MQHPCTAGPQKPRTMATVSPLHQVVPPQPNLSPYEAAGGLNAFGPSQRTSSFAAALRKLAKQAGDPITGEKDIAPISPVSSPALAQRSLTPKRNGQNAAPNQSMYLSSSGHQVNNTSFPSSSPPVVTIAPSRPHPSHTTDSRKLQVMDLGSLPQANVTPSSNGHLSDPMSLKLDSSKSGSRSSSVDKWDDHVNKSLPTSSGSSQSRPHATIAPLPRPDDSLTSSRGFQPYRSADDIRTSLPHHLSSFEHHPPAAYPYTPAFLPPPHLPHPAYRLDDALFLDRYGLLRSQVMPFPAQAGMMAAPAAFYQQSRYDLLAQSLSLSSANNSLLHHERLKLEEERRQREKEAELDHSRKREMERREKEQKEKEREHKDREKEHKEREKEHKEKEKERRDKSHREKSDHGDHKSTNHSSSSHSKRVEYAPVRNEPVAQGVSNHSSPSVTSSTTPLNLVVHPGSNVTTAAANNSNGSNNVNPAASTVEHQKKEAELWLPWQQNHTSNHHNHHSTKESAAVHEDNVSPLAPPFKPTTLLPQENLKPPPPPPPLPPPTKETPVPLEKYHAPYNMPFFAEKKHVSPEVNNVDLDTKKHTSHHTVSTNNRKFDSIHHHITELSKKDNSSSEWKHEKLQKACTNNHRKTVNEVKKLREESHHHHFPAPPPIPMGNPPVNNTHPIHHRKHLNGVVKPVLSQDEGMHARLLETEKCRIEFNSLVSNKLPQPDKLQVPNLIHGTVQVNGKEVNHQMMYMDYNHHLLSMYKQTVETVPVRSKLDKEAEDLKKRGVSDADMEEPPMKDFLVLSKGPPLSLDTNPVKIRFLKVLGLTSHLKRKKIELDIFLKRRKRLMEEPIRPPSIDLILDKENVSSNSKPLEDVLRDSEPLAEKLRAQVTPGKADFFSNLGLSFTTVPQKEENARVRRVIEDERNRRRLRIKNKAKQKAAQAAPEAERETDVKTEVNMTGESLPATTNLTDIKSTQSSQVTSIHGDQVPYVPSPPKEEQPGCNRALASSECWDLSQGKVWNKCLFKKGPSLKCELNSSSSSSSSLSSATQNNHQFTNGSLDLKNEASSSPDTHISTGTQVDLIGAFNNVCNKKGKNKNFAFNWPGLDVIIEAYYRHNKEQLVEQEVLRKKCNQLRTRQEELKKEASNSSKSMSELLKLKRDLEEQRCQTEQTIEKLKLFIQAGR